MGQEPPRMVDKQAVPMVKISVFKGSWEATDRYDRHVFIGGELSSAPIPESCLPAMTTGPTVNAPTR